MAPRYLGVLQWTLGLLVTVGLSACGTVDDPDTPRPDREDALDITADAGENVIPGQYIVVLDPDVDPPAVAARHGVSPRRVYGTALTGFAARLSQQQLATLRADPSVAYVEPDLRVDAMEQTLPTGVDRIEVDQNATANIDGNDERVDVDVAIVDTGVDLDHSDLNVHRGVDCTKGPNCARGGDGDDGNGHGTHVAGTVGALDNSQGVVGVAPGARVWAVKVLRDDGSGFLSDVIAGIDYVTDNASQVEVANLSLGAQGSSDALRTSLQNSVDAGIFYAVAAGNDTLDVYGDDGEFGTSDDIIPAAYPEVATISALSDTDGEPGGIGPLSSWGGDDRNGDEVDDGEDDSFAFFSNFSASVVDDNPVTSPGKAIDLLLPGVDIHSTWLDDGYDTISGTSMAAPHGAGLAALRIAANDVAASDASDVAAIRQALIDAGVDQDSDDGLAILNDPDVDEEHLGWAGEGVADGSPTVSWVNPVEGGTVDGTVTLQIDADDADDADDALTVAWRVDGGNWQETEYNSESGYYETSWDTGSVNDGDHTLDAQATDDDGNTSVSSITVTVDNEDETGGTSDMYVWDIAFEQKDYGPGGSFHDLTTTVTVQQDDGDGAAQVSDDPVANASVDLTLTYDTDDDGLYECGTDGDDECWTLNGTTDSDGRVSFTLKRVATGDYEAEVTDLTHSDLAWDPALDEDNPDTYTLTLE